MVKNVGNGRDPFVSSAVQRVPWHMTSIITIACWLGGITYYCAMYGSLLCSVGETNAETESNSQYTLCWLERTTYYCTVGYWANSGLLSVSRFSLLRNIASTVSFFSNWCTMCLWCALATDDSAIGPALGRWDPRRSVFLLRLHTFISVPSPPPVCDTGWCHKSFGAATPRYRNASIVRGLVHMIPHCVDVCAVWFRNVHRYLQAFTPRADHLQVIRIIYRT